MDPMFRSLQTFGQVVNMHVALSKASIITLYSGAEQSIARLKTSSYILQKRFFYINNGAKGALVFDLLNIFQDTLLRYLAWLNTPKTWHKHQKWWTSCSGKSLDMSGARVLNSTPLTFYLLFMAIQFPSSDLFSKRHQLPTGSVAYKSNFFMLQVSYQIWTG